MSYLKAIQQFMTLNFNVAKRSNDMSEKYGGKIYYYVNACKKCLCEQKLSYVQQKLENY